MWLQPVLKLIAVGASRIYYRLEVAGPPAPRAGPALFVANHPNGLLDPALVIAAAGRPLRFLAKSTLFSDLRLGWLVRGGGAIPVYRRIDDPTRPGDNIDAFEAAYEALFEGDAVGIFPEGVSHSQPSLGRLKTGAARMVLGAYECGGTLAPIVPIGLIFRRKEIFRSEALAVLGEPIDWSDLADRGPDDREAVRELTRRIGVGLRGVTVNLERWEDAPLVGWVEAIWAAEHEGDEDPTEQLARTEVITEILSALRHQRETSADEPQVREATELAAEIYDHRERMLELNLEPSDFRERSRPRGFGWSYRLLDPVSALIAAAGFAFFWIPYRLTGRLAWLARPEPETKSTYRFLLGVVVYTLWVVGLSVLAGRLWGGLGAALTLVGIPLVGLMGLRIRERRREHRRVWTKVSRVLSRRDLLPVLEEQQQSIAGQLAELFEAWQRGEIHAAVPLDED